MNKILLTGRPRCGKSSLIQNILSRFELPLGGFAMQRLTKTGKTWAFRLLDLTEESYASHQESDKLFDDIAIYMSVPGKWQGNIKVFNGKGSNALEKCLGGNQLVIMDELGIFERDALAFQASVFKILNSSLPVLGVLKDKSNPFLDNIRNHPDVSIFEYPGEQVEQKIQQLLARIRP